MYIEASVHPDCRSAGNNLYSGISLVCQVRSLISLLGSISLCFWSFLVFSFSRFLIFSFSHFLVSSFPRFLISCFGFCFVSHSVSCFGFRSVSHSVSYSILGIGFCSTILDSRVTPVPVPIPDSVSVSPSSRQHLPLILALLPRGVALL